MVAYRPPSVLETEITPTIEILHEVFIILIWPCDLKKIDYIMDIIFGQPPRYIRSCKIRMAMIVKVITSQHLVNYLDISIDFISMPKFAGILGVDLP